jgi:prepilin-type N-terminal cleavage/methylation domain-containing protein
MRGDTAIESGIRNLKFEMARGDGFTLLEVVLVTAIIATCAAIAIPRFGRATGRYQADLAARRVAADLRQAQLQARTTSASCTLAFTVATSQYQIANAPAFDGATGTYAVDLRLPPYKARIVSVSFSGAQVVFSGWGLPDSAGTVVVSSGSEQRTITLDGTTGRVSIQ